MSPHLFLRATCMYDQENLKQPADGVLLLVAIADAGMLDVAACESKEIIVVRDDDAPLGESVRDLIFVGGPKQARLDGAGHVHAVASQPNGNRCPNTLVKMIPNHHRRVCPIRN